MEFVGHETRDKQIWTSGKGRRITDKISKQGSPKKIPTRYLLH